MKSIDDASVEEWREAVKFTPWFPFNVKPVRVGEYEVRDLLDTPAKFRLTGGGRRYFDGKNWRAGWSGELISIFGTHHSHQWRGLAREPK